MQKEVLSNKAVYLMRNNAKEVNEASFETDITIGEVPVGVLHAFRALLADVYMPLLIEQEDGGQGTNSKTQEYLEVTVTGENLMWNV